jgi:hypothetical protein
LWATVGFGLTLVDAEAPALAGGTMVLDDEPGATDGRGAGFAGAGLAAAGAGLAAAGATARDLAGLALGSAAAGLVASEGRLLVEEARALGRSAGLADRDARPAEVDAGAAGRLDRPLVGFLSSSDAEALDVAVRRRVVVVPAAGRTGGRLRLLPRAERAAVVGFAVAMELALAAPGGTTPLLGAADGPAVVFLAAAAVGVAVLVALGELGLRMEDGDWAAAGLSTAVAAGSARRTGSDMTCNVPMSMGNGMEWCCKGGY